MTEDAMEQLARTFVRTSRYRTEKVTKVADIEVYGDFGNTTEIISDTSMTLLLAPGRYSDDNIPTILPFVQLAIEGCRAIDEDESRTMFRGALPLENVAFLIVKLASELKMASVQIAGMSNSDDVERGRLELIRQLASFATFEALSSVYALNQVLEPEEEDERPLPPKRKPTAAESDPGIRLRRRASAKPVPSKR